MRSNLVATSAIAPVRSVAAAGFSGGRSGPLLRRALVGENLPEQVPRLALEARQPHGLDWIEIGRARVDLDTLDDHRQLQVLHIRCLLHDVGAGELIAALL